MGTRGPKPRGPRDQGAAHNLRGRLRHRRCTAAHRQLARPVAARCRSAVTPASNLKDNFSQIQRFSEIVYRYGKHRKHTVPSEKDRSQNPGQTRIQNKGNTRNVKQSLTKPRAAGYNQVTTARDRSPRPGAKAPGPHAPRAGVRSPAKGYTKHGVAQTDAVYKLQPAVYGLHQLT